MSACVHEVFSPDTDFRAGHEAQLAGCLYTMQETLRSVFSITDNWVYWHRLIIPAPRSYRQEDQRFKVISTSKGSSNLPWAT